MRNRNISPIHFFNISSACIPDPTTGLVRRFMRTQSTAIVFALLLCFLPLCTRQARAESPDTVTLTSGEQLSGKLIRVEAGKVVFHSSVLGDVAFPLDKVKTLHAGQFAVVGKGLHLTHKTAAQGIPVGSIAIKDGAVHVTPAHGEEKLLPASETQYLIDATSFHRVLGGRPSLLQGWGGSVTLGASMVKSTDSAQTYTGALSLVRAVPTVAWLPPGSKTTLNLGGTYGLARNPEIDVNSAVVQPASVTKTDLLQGSLEYDRYFTPALFGYGVAAANHNLGSGLLVQQSYGGGIGWTVCNDSKNNLALKAAMQYEQQQFYNSNSQPLTPTKNLSAAAISETWVRSFAHSFKLSQDFLLNPALNVAQAYAATADASLIFPAYKNLNFTLASSDNYVGDPPAGFLRNTFQFTAGITYNLK